MGPIKAALALWFLCTPSKGGYLPSCQAYAHRLPGLGVKLALGDYDPVTNTSWAWIFRGQRLWRQHLVEGDWEDSQYLDFSALPNGGFVLSRAGSNLTVLAFRRGAGEDPEYFSLRAPDEASPWAVPAYRLNRRLEVELYFDTPDGPTGGKPQFRLFHGAQR